jgi:hypothetical protein
MNSNEPKLGDFLFPGIVSHIGLFLMNSIIFAVRLVYGATLAISVAEPTYIAVVLGLGIGGLFLVLAEGYRFMSNSSSSRRRGKSGVATIYHIMWSLLHFFMLLTFPNEWVVGS